MRTSVFFVALLLVALSTTDATRLFRRHQGGPVTASPAAAPIPGPSKGRGMRALDPSAEIQKTAPATPEEAKKYGELWWWDLKNQGEDLPAPKYDENGYGKGAKLPKNPKLGDQLSDTLSKISKVLRNSQGLEGPASFGVSSAGKIILNVFGKVAPDLTKAPYKTLVADVAGVGGTVIAKVYQDGELVQQDKYKLRVGDMIANRKTTGAFTAGACMRRKRLGVWRNDLVMTSFHGKGSVGDEVIAKNPAFEAPGGSSSAKRYRVCGKVESTTFSPSPLADFTTVNLEWDWMCECSGIRSATELYASIGHFLAVLTESEPVHIMGQSSGGKVEGKIDPLDFFGFNLKVKDGGVIDGAIKTSIGSIQGDSGSSLVHNGAVIGFLHGGNERDVSYYTPIWTVTVPRSYEIC